VSDTIGRRGFLAVLGGAVLLPQQDADRLRWPSAPGRARDTVTGAHNSEVIKSIERKLKCTCGCNLDIFTCRTTDFTCTYSPELHKEVVALHDAGRTPEEILDAFVAKYGEQALMAPPPSGFNLAGYLVPSIVVLTAGTILALVLLRRDRVTPVPPAAGPGAEEGDGISSEEQERLDRALAEVAD